MSRRECRYPWYKSEAVRRKSYKDWPLNLLPTPERLAEAGFFYTGYGDRTQCFFCGGGLKDWEPKADPWVQHARWHDCAFVLRKKTKEFVRQVVEDWWGSAKPYGFSQSARPTQTCTCYCPCHMAISVGNDDVPEKLECKRGNKRS